MAEDVQYEKELFREKLIEVGAYNSVAQSILDRMPDRIAVAILKHAIEEARRASHAPETISGTAETMLWVAGSNYTLRVPEGTDPSEVVIFPISESESRGIADVRLVNFRDDDGDVQIGNCGSPLEGEAGWLLLTRGVGPMRQYCIGATLLERDDPSRSIGQPREPLLVPAEDERSGYVPNVVYSCGGMIHHDTLIIPYAMSEMYSGFATVALPDLLAVLQEDG